MVKPPIYNPRTPLAAPTSAPIGYPSISTQSSDQVLLIPSLTHKENRCVALPVQSSEAAADLVRRLDPGVTTPVQQLISARAGTAAEGAGFVGTALDGLSEYFKEITKFRLEAYKIVSEQVERYGKAGGKLTDSDLAELLVKRRAAQDVLQSAHPSIFRYEIVSPDEYAEWAKLSAQISTLPPGTTREALELQYRQLQDRFVADFPSKSIRATKTWAMRMATASKFMAVFEFSANAANVFMASTTDELNKAAGKLAGQAGGVVGSALATILAEKAVVGLAVVFSATPAGWVVFSAGLVAGLAAGYYAPQVVEAYTTPFFEQISVPAQP